VFELIKKANSRGGGRAAGFTLIELVVAVGVAVALIGVTIPAISSLTSMKRKSAAQELVSTVRYLFAKAQLEHKYIRLVINIDDASYKAEEADNPVALTDKKLEVRDGRIVDNSEEEEKLAEEESKSLFTDFETLVSSDTMKWQGWYNFKNKLSRKIAQFSDASDEVIKPTKLTDGIIFSGAITSSLEKKAESGEVSIFFFPNGFVQPSVIYISTQVENETDQAESYSIKIHPLTGRAEIIEGDIEPPDFEREARHEE